MADQPQQTQQTKPEGFLKKRIKYWFGHGLDWVYNKSWFAKKAGHLPIRTLGEGEERKSIRDEFEPEFNKLVNYAGEILKIEGIWDEVERFVFPWNDDKFLGYKIAGQKDNYSHIVDTNALTDWYRDIEYFRDPDILELEINLFDHDGTVTMEAREIQLTEENKRKLMENNLHHISHLELLKDALEEAIKSNKPMKPNVMEEFKKYLGIAEDEKDLNKILKVLEENLDKANTSKGKIENGELEVPKVRWLDYKEISLPFLDGKKEEKLVVFGKQNLDILSKQLGVYNDEINTFAVSQGVPADVREQMNSLVRNFQKNLEKIKEIEDKHDENIRPIVSKLKTIK